MSKFKIYCGVAVITFIVAAVVYKSFKVMLITGLIAGAVIGGLLLLAYIMKKIKSRG